MIRKFSFFMAAMILTGTMLSCSGKGTFRAHATFSGDYSVYSAGNVPAGYQAVIFDGGNIGFNIYSNWSVSSEYSFSRTCYAADKTALVIFLVNEPGAQNYDYVKGKVDMYANGMQFKLNSDFRGMSHRYNTGAYTDANGITWNTQAGYVVVMSKEVHYVIAVTNNSTYNVSDVAQVIFGSVNVTQVAYDNWKSTNSGSSGGSQSTMSSGSSSGGSSSKTISSSSSSGGSQTKTTSSSSSSGGKTITKTTTVTKTTTTKTSTSSSTSTGGSVSSTTTSGGSVSSTTTSGGSVSSTTTSGGGSTTTSTSSSTSAGGSTTSSGGDSSSSSTSSGGDNGDDKIAVCHKPDKNGKGGETLYLPKPAVDAHLKHGDYLGQCK